MTIHTKIECNGCGVQVEPNLPTAMRHAATSGWLNIGIVGPDGINIVDVLGHLCESCKIDYKRWLEQHRAEADKRKLQ